MQKYLKILALLALCVKYTQAQHPLHLSVSYNSSDSAFLKKNVPYQPSFSDSLSLQAELNKVLVRCGELSFLQAYYTDINFVHDTCFARIEPGNSYKWVRLSRGNVPPDILSAAGFRESQFSNKIFSSEQYGRRIERILQFLENNGYPFASIRLDSVMADSGGISASLSLSKNELILFDTVGVLGNASIHKAFLQKYTGIKPGAPYNETLVKNADSRISQLPFLKLNRPGTVYFYGNKGLPIFYLDDRRASSVDGIIGFAPNSQVSNKLLLTGEANLKLQNLFSRGVALDVNYRSFLANSQDLRIKFIYPYLFNTSLALDYDLALLKLDSTFLDVKNSFGLQYRFIGTDYFRVFYSIQSTALITVDTSLVRATRSLPTSNDLRNNVYGAGFRITRYDYYLNPRSGYSVEFTAGVGIRRIVRNPTIDAIRFPNGDGGFSSIYDTLQLEQVQYNMQGTADYFIPVASRFTIRTQVNGGHVAARNLFFNELFRIGGIRTLKGFDEQSIFASSYFILNTELRYLLQQNSNFILFWNGAWYENVARTPVLSDRPYGFGAGLNFETGAGIFSLYYAVGKQFGNSIEYDKAKVHFGFVTLF